jgi:hypothetical protein
MLANSRLRHPVLALAKLCTKKKPREKKLERLKRRIACPLPISVAPVCDLQMWLAQSPPMSQRRKEFPDVCSEYEFGCAFLRVEDTNNACSELLRQNFERQ